ncbi:MAG: FHIPEP family type III secretion protein [Firmicutes bacterium]|nr:FHIPEP family type III secretion protein [Bacillota bacterium]
MKKSKSEKKPAESAKSKAPAKKTGTGRKKKAEENISPATESVAEPVIDPVDILGKEEGLLVKKEDGKLELGEDVKEMIIRAFKEETEEPVQEADDPARVTRRIFMRDDEDVAPEETAALKVINDEIKTIREENIIENAEQSIISHQSEQHRKSENPNVTHAEVVIVKDTDYAVGVTYSPGMVPKVVAMGEDQDALAVITNAFELEIPVVEVTNWDFDCYRELQLGKDIPESMYPVAAKALALIYRLKPDAQLVRFIKPMEKISGKVKSAVKKRARELEDVMRFAQLSVDVGEDLFHYREELQKQLELISNRLTAELGLPIPKTAIRSAEWLKPGEFQLKFKELTHESGTLDLTFEPPELFNPLQAAFRKLVYVYAYELLGYPEIEVLLDNLKKTDPGLVKSLFPHQFTIGALRFVLRGLLKEKIPVRDMKTILQTIEENLPYTSDPELLVEYIRAAFSRYISNAYKDETGTLNVVLFSSEVEQLIMESIKENMSVRWLDINYKEGLELLTRIGMELTSVQKLGLPFVLLTSPVIRRFTRKITEINFPEVPVVSYSEVAPVAMVKTIGIVKYAK